MELSAEFALWCSGFTSIYFLKNCDINVRKTVLISNLKYSLLFSIEIIVFILQLSLNISFLRNQVNSTTEWSSTIICIELTKNDKTGERWQESKSFKRLAVNALHTE